jgi:hypothetical protein
VVTADKTRRQDDDDEEEEQEKSHTINEKQNCPPIFVSGRIVPPKYFVGRFTN